ncbi:MAG: TonB family protein [Nitrospira sp.]|nr:TonB family protein [Nitrospira sp.]MCP9443398.1 TonB family protein [Nitrospira sp.]
MTSSDFQHTNTLLRQRSWMYSALLHGVLAGGTIALFSSLSPSMETEPFQWNVAMVESPQTLSPSDPPPEAVPQPQPLEPVTKPVQREALHHQAVQAAQPVPETTPVDREASTILAQTIPPQEELHQAVEPTPMQDTIAQEEPSLQTASVITSEPPQPTLQPTLMEPQPIVASVPQETKSVEAVVATAPSQVPAAVKTDYTWLMKALLGRINELKNYPHLARINHWEGKVVLRAVIRDDGQVIMVDVQESSGRSILDNDAMETLRKASPLKLEQPLGKPQVAILMPISYSLR